MRDHVLRHIGGLRQRPQRGADRPGRWATSATRSWWRPRRATRRGIGRPTFPRRRSWRRPSEAWAACAPTTWTSFCSTIRRSTCCWPPMCATTLARLVASGKIRAWGASTKGPTDALEALRACDVPVIQANFNMMDIRAIDQRPVRRSDPSKCGLHRPNASMLWFSVRIDRPRHDISAGRPSRRMAAPAAGELDRRGGRPARCGIGAARSGRRSGRASLLPGLSGGIEHHSRHPDAGRGRSERRRQWTGTATGMTPSPPSWKSTEIANSSFRARKLRDEVEQVAAGKQVSADPRRGGGLEIGLAVADQETIARRQPTTRRAACQHAGARLAQVRDSPVALHRAFGVIGANTRCNRYARRPCAARRSSSHVGRRHAARCRDHARCRPGSSRRTPDIRRHSANARFAARRRSSAPVRCGGHSRCPRSVRRHGRGRPPAAARCAARGFARGRSPPECRYRRTAASTTEPSTRPAWAAPAAPGAPGSRGSGRSATGWPCS